MTEAVQARIAKQIEYPAFKEAQGKSNKDSYTDEVREKMSKIKVEQLKNGKGMAYKGKLTLANPNKYVGNPNNVIWRSTWEKRFMLKLDHNPDVVAWSSEEVAIKYISPVDGRPHRYFPDMVVKMKSGEIYMYEIKPAIQTKPPVRNSRRPRHKVLQETKTYAVNNAKWAAARAYCQSHGMTFVILTEKELGIKTR